MKKVLIVEDETSILAALTAGFNRQDVKVLTAQDGEAGLKIALKEHPHIILLDLVMPKMDGITMLRKLREDKWGNGVKVIILTNMDDQEKIANAVQNKVFDYFIKANWNIVDIIKKVKIELKYIK